MCFIIQVRLCVLADKSTLNNRDEKIYRFLEIGYLAVLLQATPYVCLTTVNSQQFGGSGRRSVHCDFS